MGIKKYNILDSFYYGLSFVMLLIMPYIIYVMLKDHELLRTYDVTFNPVTAVEFTLSFLIVLIAYFFMFEEESNKI